MYCHYVYGERWAGALSFRVTFIFTSQVLLQRPHASTINKHSTHTAVQYSRTNVFCTIVGTESFAHSLL